MGVAEDAEHRLDHVDRSIREYGKWCDDDCGGHANDKARAKINDSGSSTLKRLCQRLVVPEYYPQPRRKYVDHLLSRAVHASSVKETMQRWQRTS